MKLKDWLKQIGRAPKTKRAIPPISDADVVGLIRYLETHELDCEQVFDALDRFAEIEVRHEDAAKLMPLVRDHLDMCRDCCDEHDALLDVLEKQDKQEQ